MSKHTGNPTNTYTVPSVSIKTAHTGASNKANELGMRTMQERHFSERMQLADPKDTDTRKGQ